MVQITKVVQEIGNGGHIYLPKEIVGKKVVINLIEKSLRDIEGEIIEILRPYFRHIGGIYLYGSYVRGEQTPESDIDILVITDGNVKIKKRVNEYEIVSGSLEGIERTLKNNAVLILPLLKEAKSILNNSLIERYRKFELTKKNTRWYIESTETSLNLCKEYISFKDNKNIPNIVYPLIMRLRGLSVIKSLVEKKIYSNKESDKHLVSGGLSSDKVKQITKIYRLHRDNKEIPTISLNYEDINRLYNIVYKYYIEVKKLWEKLK